MRDCGAFTHIGMTKIRIVYSPQKPITMKTSHSQSRVIPFHLLRKLNAIFECGQMIFSKTATLLTT